MRYLLGFLLMYIGSALQAQDTKEPVYTRAGVDVLFHTTALDDFNQLLEANGFAALDDEAVFFNFYSKSGKASSRWMSTLGFSYYQRGSSAVRPLTAPPFNTVDLLGFGLNSGFEYRLLDTKYFFLNPTFVFGIDYYKMAFTEGVRATDLGSILTAEVNTYSASSFQVPISAGLRAGVNIPIREKVVSLTVSGGYRLHLDNGNWRLNDVVRIDDNIDLSSLYFGLGLEIGFFQLESK